MSVKAFVENTQLHFVLCYASRPSWHSFLPVISRSISSNVRPFVSGTILATNLGCWDGCISYFQSSLTKTHHQLKDKTTQHLLTTSEKRKTQNCHDQVEREKTGRTQCFHQSTLEHGHKNICPYCRLCIPALKNSFNIFRD